MKRITLIMASVAGLLIASCTGKRAAGETINSEAGIESAADSVAPGPDTRGRIPKDLNGIYTDINDGSTLWISDSTGYGACVKINLFRLTDIDDGIGKFSDGTLSFTATDAAGQPIGGKITFDGDTAHLTFTESTWEYLPEGSTYSFIRGKEAGHKPTNPIGG